MVNRLVSKITFSGFGPCRVQIEIFRASHTIVSGFFCSEEQAKKLEMCNIFKLKLFQMLDTK